MENPPVLKVAKTSRATIESISNSKEEYSALISEIDKEMGDNSQLVRISKGASNANQVGEINKLKIHRMRLNDMLVKMELMKDDTWGLLRPKAQKIYEAAAASMK